MEIKVRQKGLLEKQKTNFVEDYFLFSSSLQEPSGSCLQWYFTSS